MRAGRWVGVVNWRQLTGRKVRSVVNIQQKGTGMGGENVEGKGVRLLKRPDLYKKMARGSLFEHVFEGAGQPDASKIAGGSK